MVEYYFADTPCYFPLLTKRNEGYSNTGHGKPKSLHGLSSLCESLRDCDGLVVAALIDPHGFWLFALMLSIVG